MTFCKKFTLKNLAVITLCDFTFPTDFNDEQKTALLAASEFIFDIDWAIDKIRKGEYELWDDATDYKQLGETTAESLELPDWALIYFDFEKFGYDIAAEHRGTLTSFGWFIFK